MRALGISERHQRVAKARLGVHSRKADFGEGWVWDYRRKGDTNAEGGQSLSVSDLSSFMSNKEKDKASMKVDTYAYTGKCQPSEERQSSQTTDPLSSATHGNGGGWEDVA
jgi:hypothetical protein